MILFASATFLGLISAQDGRFDHGQHPDHLKNCNSCHRLQAKDQWAQKVRVGRAGGLHRACTSCHLEEWTRFRPAKGLSFCRTCHVGLAPRRLRFRKVAYPPYRTGQDSRFFLPAFDHGQHARTGTPCSQCHGTQSSLQKPGHAACSVCHGERVLPGMASCEGCHRLGTAKERAVDSVFAVDVAFSHPSHARHANLAGCQDCHDNVQTPAGEPIPMPAKNACERCHDGTAAFSVLGNCLQCHAGKTDVQRPVQRPKNPSAYGHADHAAYGGPSACEACHASDPTGRLRFPVPNADHKPCSGCHAAEFRKKDSALCFTCHLHNQPWQPNPRLKAFQGPSEFAVGFPHRTHQNTDCDSCHPVQGARKVPPAPAGLLAPGHRRCASCHAREHAPNMTACGGCHQPPSASGVPGSATSEAWRVTASFSHETHRLDPKNQRPVACARCHAEVSSSDVTPPPRPQKRSCETCHEGNTAFHVTGFDCYRCHAQPS